MVSPETSADNDLRLFSYLGSCDGAHDQYWLKRSTIHIQWLRTPQILSVSGLCKLYSTYICISEAPEYSILNRNESIDRTGSVRGSYTYTTLTGILINIVRCIDFLKQISQSQSSQVKQDITRNDRHNNNFIPIIGILTYMLCCIYFN